MIELGNALSRYLDFLRFAKREREQRDKCTEYSESCHPPDMPDQGKAGDDSKESSDETGCAASWHRDRLVLGQLHLLPLPRLSKFFAYPKSVSTSDLWQDRIVPCRRRRGR